MALLFIHGRSLVPLDVAKNIVGIGIGWKHRIEAGLNAPSTADEREALDGGVPRD
jgi:hypothetical protein